MQLEPLARTALVPFWARANDAVAPRPILGDVAAALIAPRVRELLGSEPVSRSTQAGCCLRNLLTDRWVTELADATTTIIEIGVGLSTRVNRLPHVGRQYVEVDLESLMRMRDELFPAGEAVRIAGDGMDVKRWAGALDSDRGGRVIITLEGVLAYQAPHVVERFFSDAAVAVPGAYVVFDRLSPAAVSRANSPRKRLGGRPEYRWPRDGRDSRAGGGGLKVLRAQSFMDLPHGLRSRLPLRDRMFHSFPPLRGAYKLLLCQLPTAGGE